MDDIVSRLAARCGLRLVTWFIRSAGLHKTSDSGPPWQDVTVAQFSERVTGSCALHAVWHGESDGGLAICRSCWRGRSEIRPVRRSETDPPEGCSFYAFSMGSSHSHR